jgi:hypothetical protein
MTITLQDRRLPARRDVPAGGIAPLALLDLLQEYVDEIRDLIEPVDAALKVRSYDLLELTDELEIWVIHWPTGYPLELHDHGGSVGALWVLNGELREQYVAPNGSLARRHFVSGGGAAFGPLYVHDVVNDNAAPATSVHAYSPPMPSMTFYRMDQADRLAADRTQYRDDPTWCP